MNNDQINALVNEFVICMKWNKNIEVFSRFIGEVKFAAPRFQIDGVKKYKGVCEELDGSYEVIGNIYEHPHLLAPKSTESTAQPSEAEADHDPSST